MKLWEQFDRLVVFDTETTGFSPKKDKIIELGAVAAGPEGELGRMDALLSLPEGAPVSITCDGEAVALTEIK